MKFYSVTGSLEVPEKMLLVASKLAAALRKRQYQARVGVDPLSLTMLDAALNEGMIFSEDSNAGLLSINTNTPDCHSRAMRYFKDDMINDLSSRSFYRSITARLCGVSCATGSSMLITYSNDGAYSIQTFTMETEAEVKAAITLAEMTHARVLNLAIPHHLGVAVEIIKKANHNPMKQMLMERNHARV